MKPAATSVRQTDAGVTLVEVLVVLVLVSIMAGVVGLSIGRGPRGNAAEQEADLLVARLNRAADEAILTGIPMGFVWGSEGYRFDIYDGEAWVPHELPILKEPHLLSGGTRIAQGSGAMIVATDLRPSEGGALSLELSAGGGAVEYVRFDGINALRLREAE